MVLLREPAQQLTRPRLIAEEQVTAVLEIANLGSAILDMEADFIGKAALRQIREQGVSRRQVGLVIDAEPLKGPNTTFWPINAGEAPVGKVTSAVYSPRLKQNIALAMVSTENAAIGTELEVAMPQGKVQAQVVERPFFDPKKKIASG